MPASAALLVCLVIAVTDGDSLKVRCDGAENDKPVSIRIAAIDAPEILQPFGRVSKKRLAWLCANERALVQPLGLDRYGRTLAQVQCKGKDAGLDMIRAGMAWAYPFAQNAQAASAAQAESQGARRGLFKDAGAQPPWEYRRRAK